MGVSDFLTIIVLAIAVWSIIAQNQRKFVLLFFPTWSWWVLAISLFAILYLMSFDWILKTWEWSCLEMFTFEIGIPASVWAFIIALVIILITILNISFGYFAESKLDNLISLYKSLIKENDIDLLASYINKYHIEDISTYMKGVGRLPDYGVLDHLSGEESEYDKARKKLTKPKRIKFAANVYGYIIQNEIFIKNAASKYPELFATVFKAMETEKAANEDLAKTFIGCLFDNNNVSFFQELKTANNNDASIESQIEYAQLPILSGLLLNTKVAAQNNVWYPVGEGMIKSIKYDVSQIDFLAREYDSDLESELWDYKIWNGLIFFKYMVRETIYRTSGNHMWLYYFRYTVDLLIENIPAEENYNQEKEYPSFAHYVIHKHFEIMFDWIELAKNQNTSNQVIDTVKCLGWCIESLCEAPEAKISPEFKITILDNIVYKYCNYAFSQDNVACTTAREWLKKMFANPKYIDMGAGHASDQYLIVLTEVWSKFDRVKFTDNESVLTEFEEEILLPHGIVFE